MDVKHPESGEIIYADDCVVIQIETLMEWTDSLINVAGLRTALAKRMEKKWDTTTLTEEM